MFNIRTLAASVLTVAALGISSPTLAMGDPQFVDLGTISDPGPMNIAGSHWCTQSNFNMNSQCASIYLNVGGFTVLSNGSIRFDSFGALFSGPGAPTAQAVSMVVSGLGVGSLLEVYDPQGDNNGYSLSNYFGDYGLPGSAKVRMTFVNDIGDYNIDAVGFDPARGFPIIVDSISFLADGAAVPEPASWTMMIVGFGMTGAMLRRRRSGFASA